MKILLKNTQIVDVLNRKVKKTNLSIRFNQIKRLTDKFIEKDYDQIIDLEGRYLSAGLIDGHIHIESTSLTPDEFAHLVVRFGTTAVVADPHEIVNVSGIKGMTWMLKKSKNLPIDIFYLAPSCVPATPFETGGGIFGLKEIKKVLKQRRVLGLAEVMNYPGVIAGDKELLAKIQLTRKLGKIVDGHCPGLTGRPLEKYIKAGISSDHEATNIKEGREKLRRGMWLMIREGSAAKNLAALLPLIKTKYLSRLMFVTDDKHVDELVHQGHLNWILKKAVSLGGDPFLCLRLVTYNPAQYFQFKNRGLIEPGYLANLVVFNDLKNFNVFMTIKEGKIVYQKQKCLTTFARPHQSCHDAIISTVAVKKIDKNSFQIKLPEKYLRKRTKTIACRVISVIDKQIVTDQEIINLPLKNRQIYPSLEKDVLKIAVVERHKKTGHIGLGFVKNFGIKNGALATTVAHDSHNIIVVGTTDKQILTAVKKIIEIKGGYVVVKNNQVIASLPLPVAGLMSDQSWEKVYQQAEKLNASVHQQLTPSLTNPFMILSFLALPVIPKLKITDKGLFDVTKFRFVDLIIGCD